jgi:hypothetical protein
MQWLVMLVFWISNLEVGGSTPKVQTSNDEKNKNKNVAISTYLAIPILNQHG